MNENSLFRPIPVHDDLIGLRADKALGMITEVGSRAKAAWLLENQRVRINGKIPKSSQIIKSNDQIEIWFPEITPSELTPLSLKLDIKFEDNDILVINKPAGLVVHPAVGHEQDTLVNALLNHTKELSMRFGEQRPGIVHRLDKDTSGLIVVAKNNLSHENLSLQFKDRSIHRKYFAATMGAPPKDSGKIESCLARSPHDRMRYASVRDTKNRIITAQEDAPDFGKWAITNYRTLVSLPSGISYLELKLETGRTHQIRVHLSEMGCPIIADTHYGANRKLKNLGIKIRALAEAFPRFALHAAELGFVHPRTGEELFFATAWPDDLSDLLRKMELIK